MITGGIGTKKKEKMKSVKGLDGAFFTQSLRGKPLIVYNHYSYCKHSVRNGISRWTCSTHSYKCCKAVVKTKGSHIIEVKGYHNHDASDLLINRGKPLYYSSLSEIILDKTCDGILPF